MSYKWTGSLGFAVVAALSGACSSGSGGGGGGGGAVLAPLWVNQFRLPTSSNLRTVRFANDLQGIVAGEASSFFRTDDGGLTWFQQEHAPRDQGGDVVSIDAFLGSLVAVGSTPTGAPRAWESEGGLQWTTWSYVPPPAPPVFSTAPYTAVDIVLAAAYGSPSVSFRLHSDGQVDLISGPSSAATNTASGPWGSANCLEWFGFSGIAYIGGSATNLTDGQIQKTLNSGTDWAAGPQVLPGGTPVIRAFSFPLTDPLLRSDNGYACGNNSTVIKTINGANWANSNTGITAGVTLRSVHFPVDMTTGWVVGSGGNIWKTTNDGANWTQQTVTVGGPVTTDLYDVWFLDNNTGYAVGDNGIVLKCTNGTTWENLTKGTLVQINALDFTSNGQTGLAVGNVSGTATILRTLDGGTTWTPFATGAAAEDYYGVSIPDAGSGNVAYVCGTNGTILRNLDVAGVGAWSAMTSNAGANLLRAIHFPADDTGGVCVGDNNTIVFTDTGTTSPTWTAATTKPAAAPSYRSLSSVRDTLGNVRMYAGGTGGVVAGSLFPTSTTWTTVGIPTVPGTPTVQALQSVFDSVALADVLFAAGSNNTLNRLQVGGAWTSPGAAPAGATAANGLAFTSTLLGWWVSNGIYTTVDGGATWTLSPDHTKSTLSALWMDAAGLVGYAAGASGTILKTTTGGK